MKHYLESKLLYRHSKKVLVLLFIAVASVSIAESFAASNTLTVTTDVQSKFKSVNADRAIEDQYIVVLKNQYVDLQMSSMFGQASTNSASAMSYRRSVVANAVTEMATIHSATVKKQYHAALSGFVAQMTAQDMRALLVDDRVAFIEQDQIMRANVTQSNATQGLDRIDQANLPLDLQYNYDFDGSGVHAYVIDTGIFVAHNDFAGRAINGRDFVDNDDIAEDCNGHGTHVAGTIGSSTYGVAKNVSLVAVRVLGCDGSGANSGVIAGIDWVAQNAIHPAVANMSLGGASSTALDNAVQNAINSGVTFAVAAGNSNSDACIGSPNRVADALTVASSTSADARSSFSSWGTCVDLFAPGSSITSTWNDGGNLTISGTSMASPHVAGVAALYLQNNLSASPATVHAAIVSNAISGKITDISGSPNFLLQSKFNGSTSPVLAPTPPANNVLEKAVAVTSLSGLTGSEIYYTMEVPAGATNLNFNISNGTGDADLYVKFGSAPTTISFDCRPYLNGNIENCNFPSPGAGTYHVMLKSFNSFSGVSLVGDYTSINNGGADSFFENTTNIDIPDSNSSGVASIIDVIRERSVDTFEITVDIKHTYIGDLVVELYWPNGAKQTLRNGGGGSIDNLLETYIVNAGASSLAVGTGTWELRVKDMAGSDIGYIDSWSITFK